MRKSIHTRPYRAFKTLLKEVRVAKGMTQGDLARKLRVHQSHISKCEAGERRLDVLELRKWCEALSLPLARFVERLEDRL